MLLFRFLLKVSFDLKLKSLVRELWIPKEAENFPECSFKLFWSLFFWRASSPEEVLGRIGEKLTNVHERSNENFFANAWQYQTSNTRLAAPD